MKKTLGVMCVSCVGWMLAATGPAMAQAPADAPQLVLVTPGETPVPLVVSAAAAPWTRRAAGELADYIEKISGVRPEIIAKHPEPIPNKAIWVGMHPALAELLPELDLTFRHPEEIVIAATGNHLVIAGRDVWDPELPSVRGRFNSEVTDWQQEYGTANAVYTFLQDFLDVRWLWPGELGEDLIKRDTIAFAPFTFRYHPPFRLRCGMFIFSARGDNRGRGGSHDWTRRQRLQLDSSRNGTSTRVGNSIGGHAFGKWWGRFHETRPEYFALQPDGTRSGFPNPGNAKLCQSNPAVVEQWLADVEAMLVKEPDRTIFNVSPNDGHSSGICVCANCLARDHPEGQPWRYQWQGVAQEYVAMSDRYLTFANNAARALKARFPERNDCYVLLHGYGPATPPPVAAKADDNVMIGYVGFFPLAGTATRQAQKSNWAGWARAAQAMVYRPNLWYFGGGVWGLPEVALEETAEDFRFLADHNCFGFYVDYCAEHWGTMLPQYYLMGRLGWNPYADAEAIMADWYRRGFGSAADSIQAYWALLGKAWRDVMGHPDHGEGGRYTMTNARIMKEVFNKDLLERAEALLDRAATQAGDGPERFRQRVAFVRDGFDFVSLMYQAADDMARVRDSKGRDTEAVRAVIAAWEAIDALAERNPLAFNHTYVTHRMQGGYASGVRDFFGPPKKEFLQAAGLVAGDVLDLRLAAGQQGFLKSAGLKLVKDAPVPAKQNLTAPTPAEGAAAAPPTVPARPVPARTSSDAKLRPAEIAGWELVFQDDFEQAELGGDWRIVDGDWSVSDGVLQGSGTLISAHGFPVDPPPGFIRLEFDAQTDVKPVALLRNAAPAQVSVSDVSAFIHAQPYDAGTSPIQTGYFFQFGGFMNTQNRIRRAGQELIADTAPEKVITPGKLHRIVVENDGGTVRLYVDGDLVLAHQETASIVGQNFDRVGFYFYTRVKVQQVKVYVKRLADDLI